MKPYMDVPEELEGFDFSGVSTVIGQERGAKYNLGETIGSGVSCVARTCTQPSELTDEPNVLAIKIYASKAHFAHAMLARQVAQENVEEIIDVGAIAMRRDDNESPFKCFPYVIMPKYATSLRHYVSDFAEQTDCGLHSSVVASIAAQLFKAIGALERAGIVHGDVKPSNVMLRAAPAQPSDNFVPEIVLIDFGGADKADENGECGGSSVGTTGYTAPELLSESPYTSAVDIWSAMLTVYYAITGDHLIDVYNDAELGDPDTLGITLDNDEDEYSFTTKYAHIVLMYHRIGRPPESFCAMMRDYYRDNAPRYHRTLQPQCVAMFMSNVYNGLTPEQTQSIEAFLMRGLRYMPDDRAHAHEILADAFIVGKK